MPVEHIKDVENLVCDVRKKFEGTNHEEWVRVQTMCGRLLWHHPEKYNRLTGDVPTCFACLSGG